MRAGIFAMASGLVICAHAAFADHTGCYQEGNAPAGLPDPTQEQRADVSVLGLGYHLTPIFHRKLCGLEGAQDVQYIERIIAFVGCALGSDLGRQQSGLVKDDLAGSWMFFVGVDIRAVATPEELTAHCALAGQIDMGLMTASISRDDAGLDAAALSQQVDILRRLDDRTHQLSQRAKPEKE